MKISIYLFLLIKLIYAHDSKIFEDFIEKYNKDYDHDEFYLRYNVFVKNNDFIQTNNIYNNNFKLELNQFSDLSIHEFEKEYLLLNTKENYDFLSISSKDLLCDVDKELLNLSNDTPLEFDWEKQNKVTPVKHQGNCGSCWAFSTVAAIESLNSIMNNELLNLSEQELLDCAGDEYKNKGCNGGLMENAFHYVMDKGLCSENNYRKWKLISEK